MVTESVRSNSVAAPRSMLTISSVVVTDRVRFYQLLLAQSRNAELCDVEALSALLQEQDLSAVLLLTAIVLLCVITATPELLLLLVVVVLLLLGRAVVRSRPVSDDVPIETGHVGSLGRPV